MTAARRRWLGAGVLLVGLLTPEPSPAGPYLGEWAWFWRPAPDCPRGAYSPLHYWAPELYVVRSFCRPSHLDQYPPGPCPPPPAVVVVQKYRCTAIPPTPTAPYADPAGYYGRFPVPSTEAPETLPEPRRVQ